MKKVCLISSFCDNQEKINVLSDNLDIINSLNIDTILISPFFLPKEIVDKVSYFFITRDNPVLSWPIKSMFFWRQIFLNDDCYVMSRTIEDYGWAGLTQVKQLSQIGLLFDYEQFFQIIYDIKIDENVLQCFNSDKICNIYPSKRGDEIWKVGLHLMVFDRENLKKFISNIELQSYLDITHNSDAFVWLEKIQNVFPYLNETQPVEDQIYYYEHRDVYDYSPCNFFSMFIVKDDETKESIKLLFYNVREIKHFSIKINSEISQHLLCDYYLVDLKLPISEINRIEILYDDFYYDITSKIKNVRHNTLRKC